MTFLAEQGMSLYFRGLAALVIADSAYVLRHGVMVTQGTPAVLQQGEQLSQAYLGGS